MIMVLDVSERGVGDVTLDPPYASSELARPPQYAPPKDSGCSPGTSSFETQRKVMPNEELAPQVLIFFEKVHPHPIAWDRVTMGQLKNDVSKMQHAEPVLPDHPSGCSHARLSWTVFSTTSSSTRPGRRPGVASSNGTRSAKNSGRSAQSF